MRRAGARRCAVAAMLLTGVLSDAPAAEPAAADCDLAHGARVYQKCAVCHPNAPAAPHGAGPNLHGLWERPVGKVEGFRFSKAMRESQANWDRQHLDRFLENPRQLYKRTRMAFGGLKNARDRAAVLCFLRDSGASDRPE